MYFSRDSKIMPHKHNVYLLILALILSVLIWIGYGILLYNLPYFCKWEVRGQFGDMYGALNALFSVMAFSGVIYTMFLQKKALDYQLEEIKATTNNVKLQNHLQFMTGKLQAVTALLENELQKRYPDSKLIIKYQKYIEDILINLNIGADND